MHRLSERLRAVWIDALGFTPKILGTFDHISAGFDSRIIVGYENLRQIWKKTPKDQPPDGGAPILSLVIDTTLPARELYGVSAELGLIDSAACRVVDNPKRFFFKNSFNYRFDVWQPLVSDAAERILAGRRESVRDVSFRKIMGGFDLVRRHFQSATSCDDVLLARKSMMQRINRGRFAGRQLRWSEALPIVGEVLSESVSAGLDFSQLPGVQESGFARLVNEDGTEVDLINEWDTSLPSLIASKHALPTAPLAVFASSLLFPHYGNDYGLLKSLSEWSGIEAVVVAGDGENGWPTGHITFPRKGGALAKVHNVLSDVLAYYTEEYAELVAKAVEEKKSVFDIRAGQIGETRQPSG